MPDLTPMTRQEKFLNGDTDLEPITRREYFYAGRESELPEGHQEPETREEWFIKEFREAGDVTVEEITITENGTTTAPSGKAYSPIHVNVPLPSNAYLLKSVTTPTPIASFNDGEEMVIPTLKVAIEPQQEGSGDPSPTNIRPISGWSEANVSVASKNLVNWKWNTFNDGKLEIFLKGGTYTLSAESILTNGNAYIRGTKPSGEYVSREELGLIDWGVSSTSGAYYGGGGQQTYTFNVPNGGAKIEFGKLNNNGTISAQLEFGSTATAYEPYNGQTYTVDLGGTRYGGVLDVVNGVLTVDRVYKQVKDFDWQTQSGYYGRFFTVPSGADKALSDSNKSLIISDTYKGYSDAGKPANTNGVYIGSGGSIKVWDSEYNEETDIDAWKTARANVELCYYLATPIEIQLTPTAVKSLEGVNNIFADSGQVQELSYFSKEV